MALASGDIENTIANEIIEHARNFLACIMECILLNSIN
jgi:hypothetical protein